MTTRVMKGDIVGVSCDSKGVTLTIGGLRGELA